MSDWVKSKAPGPSVVPAAKEKPIAGLQVFPALVNEDSFTVIFLISKNIWALWIEPETVRMNRI